MTKKILFTPSDNNATSGAFLSMVRLLKILMESYGYDVLVLLHNDGTGEKLLKENKIAYKKIRSFNWFVPYHPKELKRKIKKFLCYFWMPITYIYNKIVIRRISQLLKKEKIDIVHINTSCCYVGAEAAKQSKIPYVWHIREFLEEDQERTIWNKKLAKRLMSNSNCVITISNSLYKKYINFIPTANVKKIYNGIDESKFLQDRRKINISNTKNIIMVGSINKSKGQIQAIKACQLLKNRNISNFSLSIIGKTSDYSRSLENYVKENSMEEFVRFLGPKENIEEYYFSSDIVLMCSEAEAFGRVTVEAMMAGCLVIGANSGCTPELIEDGYSGILYKSGDYFDLANKIEFALNNANYVRKIVENGRNVMLRTMTAKENAEKINDIYNQL